MDIIVKYHAITQYRKKTFSTLDDQEIKKVLKIIAQRGVRYSKRPGDAFAMKYNGISIVAKKERNQLIVITCLGNKQYADWSREHDIRPRYKKAAM